MTQEPGPCSHPRTYWTTDGGGRAHEFCRECGRLVSSGPMPWPDDDGDPTPPEPDPRSVSTQRIEVLENEQRRRHQMQRKGDPLPLFHPRPVQFSTRPAAGKDHRLDAAGLIQPPDFNRMIYSAPNLMQLMMESSAMEAPKPPPIRAWYAIDTDGNTYATPNKGTADDWKRYGRQIVEMTPIAAPAPEPAGFNAGIEAAADVLRRRIDDYVSEKGIYDPDTGAVEFPGNGEETVGDWTEIEDEIRSLMKGPTT